jgi:hypothetical protein
MVHMENLNALDFARLARDVTSAARACGLEQPAFRSPPALRGRTRSVKRYADGSAVVAVALHGRSRSSVLHDMIEGIVVVNRLPVNLADAARRTLLRLSSDHLRDAA